MAGGREGGIDMHIASRHCGGQAMIEFVVAIFAVVIIIAGITEFIGLAGKRGELFSEIRGKVGKQAIEHKITDAEVPQPPALPTLETTESALARGFLNDTLESKFELSKAMKEWVFDGKVDTITVRGQVWMPSLRIGGLEE